jgi:hypothetical protein
MDERKAAALLKQRFEAAGFKIAENVSLDEGGLRFEVDGYDAEKRVGYEYVTAEAGDSWDVDGDVIAELAARRARGELSILVVTEDDAPDEASLGKAADAFLASQKSPGGKPEKTEKAKPPKTPPKKEKAKSKKK